MKFVTTFNALRKAGACEPGYKTLAKHLGGVSKYGANKEINLLTILESNGLGDALWCFRAIITDDEKAADRIKRLIAAEFAESVLHIFESKRPNDDRPRKAVEAARKFANGEITADDLAIARRAAAAAAADAAYAAADAADAYAAAYAAYAADAYAARKAKKDQLAEIVKKYLTE